MRLENEHYKEMSSMQWDRRYDCRLGKPFEQITRIKCARCGLIYFAEKDYPRPKYDLAYNEYFCRPGDIRKAGMIAALIADIIAEHLGGARILEVGPGNGLTAFLLDKQNFEVVTTDEDWLSCCKIIADYKLPAWPGKFEESQIRPFIRFYLWRARNRTLGGSYIIF